MMIGLLFLLLMESEPPLDCENAMTQAAMNQCAHQEYQAADAQLNVQWQVTAAAMKLRDQNFASDSDMRKGYFSTLQEAQRAWITYRDAHCRSEGYFARGGSMEPMLVSFCLANVTIARTRQLKQLAETY